MCQALDGQESSLDSALTMPHLSETPPRESSAGLTDVESESVSHSAVSLWRPHGLWPARLVCPWDFPGKNTGEGNYFPL